MKLRPKTPAVGDLVYSDSHGPGIVTEVFVIRKSQPRMLTVLFGGNDSMHVYESDVKIFQRVERHHDGSVSIVFDHKSA